MEEKRAEEAGGLDFPISPALGSTGPFVGAGAAMMGLTMVALACLPVMCPLDVALLSMQSLVVVLSWLVCDAQQESAETWRGVAGDRMLGRSGAAEASLLSGEREFPVRDVTLIGRGEECHIRLDDAGVGARQVLAVAGGGRVAVVNIGAGEMDINGVVLSEGQLLAGDVLRVGDSSFLCYVDQEVRGERGPVGALGAPGRVVLLAPGNLYWIGRGGGCDVVVDEAGVAERQAVVAVGAGGTAVVVDFTRPLRLRVLADGDGFAVGQRWLTFHERV